MKALNLTVCLSSCPKGGPNSTTSMPVAAPSGGVAPKEGVPTCFPNSVGNYYSFFLIFL